MLARTTLKVWVTKLGSGAASIYVAPTSANWDEATVNWSNQPVPTAIAPTSQRATRAQSWVVFDVGAMLADALQSQKTAIGFLLSSDGSVFLDSKESTSTSHPAELQIILAGPQGLPGSPGPAGDWARKALLVSPDRWEPKARPVTPDRRVAMVTEGSMDPLVLPVLQVSQAPQVPSAQ